MTLSSTEYTDSVKGYQLVLAIVKSAFIPESETNRKRPIRDFLYNKYYKSNPNSTIHIGIYIMTLCQSAIIVRASITNVLDTGSIQILDLAILFHLIFVLFCTSGFFHVNLHSKITLGNWLFLDPFISLLELWFQHPRLLHFLFCLLLLHRSWLKVTDVIK